MGCLRRNSVLSIRFDDLSDKWNFGAGGLRVPVAYMEYEVVGGSWGA